MSRASVWIIEWRRGRLRWRPFYNAFMKRKDTDDALRRLRRETPEVSYRAARYVRAPQKKVKKR